MDEERDYSPADEYAEDYSEDAASELDAAEIDAYAAEYDEAPLEGEIVAPDEAVEDAAEPYDEASEESSPEDVWAEDNTADAYATDAYAAPPPAPPASEAPAEPSTVDESERLRQPRAHAFRRRLQTQIAMLPLALALIALGAFLSARAFGVEGLPEISDTTLALGFGGALAFTAVFHSLVFGRRERGLLFFGLLVWVTAGVIYAVLEFVEPEPDAAEWWPLLLVALGVTFLLTFALERGHDVRLILLGVLALVAAGTAFTVTTGVIEQDLLDQAADYWPLLVTALGIGLLPLAFRRRSRFAAARVKGEPCGR